MKREVNGAIFIERLDILSHEEKRSQWGIDIDYQKINMILDEANLFSEDFDFEFLNIHLAAIAKVKPSYITKWKKEMVIPSIKYLVRIADAFDVSIEWLIGVEDAIKVSENNSEMDETDEYEVFKKYGFTFPAYQGLRKIKRQNVDIASYISGLNKLLEYYTFSYYTNKDIVMNGAVLADDSYSDEDKLIDDEGNQIVDKEDRKYFKRYHFPILYALNEFYDLREKGTDVVFKGTTFKEIMDKIDNNKYSPVSEEGYAPDALDMLLIRNIKYHSAVDMEALAMHKLTEALKRSKGKLVKERLDAFNMDSSELRAPIYLDYGIILEQLNNYYKYEDYDKKTVEEVLEIIDNQVEE